MKNVTVYFGYMLYDASRITISQYEGQKLVPDSIPHGYIFGIGLVVPQTPAKRLLQVVPPQMLSINTIANPTVTPTVSPTRPTTTTSTPISIIRMINATDPPFQVYPVIVARNQSQQTAPTRLAASSNIVVPTQ